MEKLILIFIILISSSNIFCLSSWKRLPVNDKFKRRFPLVRVKPSPGFFMDYGGLEVIVNYKYCTFEYSGAILRCYLLFEGNTYIYIGSDYRYFYGCGDITIKNYFNIPETLLNKRVDKLLIMLIYTVDPEYDQNRVITSWEYKFRKKNETNQQN